MDKSINEALIALNLKKVYEELDQLKLRPGRQGPQGARGERGIPGERGSIGEQGPKGDQGPKGERGFIGEQGPQGLIGPQGIPGKDGLQGPQGIRGEIGPIGPKGDKGDKGDIGLPGLVGPQGPKGDKGDKGDKGETGPQGIQGPIGEKGDTGSQGLKGDRGDKGDTGEQGPKGDMGPQGIPGPKGEKGDKGDTGPQGPEGPAGKDAVVPDITPIIEKGISQAQNDFNRWRSNVTKSLASIGGGGLGEQDVIKLINTLGGGSGNANITVSTTPPTGVIEGALWWASDEGQLYIYYDNQWIQAAESVLARETVLLDSAAVINLIDSDYINARVIQSAGIDSDAVINLIDSDYINARVIQSAGTDSATVVGLITSTVDSDYVNARVSAETDPIVGAITGIIKADGAGNISAAVAGSDYIATETFTSLVQDTTPQLGGDLDAQSAYKIVNLVSPSNNGDATNKIYVDSLTQYLADNRLVYIRSGDTNVNSSTDTVLDWNSELVASTIPDFTHASGVFTNTSTRTRRFLFQMQVAIRAQSTAFTEADIWFSYNGTFNSTNRRGQTNFTGSTSAVMLTTSWTFTLAQNETVRGYFWCNQASVYGNTQSPPSSSFGNQYSSLIEVQELN